MLNPPFIVRTSNFMAIAFKLNADEAQKLLPEDVIIKSDDGLASGGMEIYTTDQVYGLPQHTIAFLYLQVSGKTKDAPAGNWPIWGAVSDNVALQSFKQFYNFPYSFQQIKIEKDGDLQTVKVGENQESGLTLTLQSLADKPVSAEGLATLYSHSLTGEHLATQIHWLASGNQTKVVSLEVNAGDSKVLQAIKKIEPVYSQLSSNAFSYSTATKQ